jgi:hypothetical protein
MKFCSINATVREFGSEYIVIRSSPEKIRRTEELSSTTDP